jgi:hypothetical protein
MRNIASSVGHLGSDSVGPLEVACYVPHQGTGIVPEVLQNMQTSP